MNQPVVFVHTHQQQMADGKRWIQLAGEPQDMIGELCRGLRDVRPGVLRRIAASGDC